jgi:hypothetical protein
MDPVESRERQIENHKESFVFLERVGVGFSTINDDTGLGYSSMTDLESVSLGRLVKQWPVQASQGPGVTGLNRQPN